MRVTLLVCCLVFALGPSWLDAQESQYFLVSGEHSSGGGATSASYRLESAGFGSGAVPGTTASANYRLAGGFPASFAASGVDKPWLTGLRADPFVTRLGRGGRNDLVGIELDLGQVQVTVGRIDAIINDIRRTRVDIGIPPQPVPGWQPIELTNENGKSTVQRGVGVLPLLDLAEPWGRNLPNGLVYRGRTGDSILWILAERQFPNSFRLPGYHYALQLDPTNIFVFFNQVVTRPDGLAFMNFPAVPLSSSYYFQVFALSSGTGYQPGSFTNLLIAP
jgi:hypothetical protein